MPMGFNKGVKLKEIPDRELRGTRKWCREREEEGQDWSSLINAIDQVLEDRQGMSLGLEEV